MGVFRFISNILMYLVPLAVLGMFIFSLIRYIDGKKQQRRDPDSISPAALRGRLIMFVVFAAILGVMITVIVAIALLMMMAVAYM